MVRTEAQKRAVKLIRAAARAVIAEVDSRSDERVGTDFWAGFPAWAREVMDERFHTISPEDFDLFHLTDDVEEAVDLIHETFLGKRPCAERLPRFETDEVVPTGEGTLRTAG